MGTVIKRFRIDLIQVTTTLDRFTDPSRRLPHDYYQRFRKAVNLRGDAIRHSKENVPWLIPPPDQPFWKWYLDHRDLAEAVKEGIAWESAVPFRVRLKETILPDSTWRGLGLSIDSVRTTVVGYDYVHGWAINISLDVKGHLGIAEFVTAAQTLRQACTSSQGRHPPITGLFGKLAKRQGSISPDTSNLGPVLTVVTVIEGVPDSGKPLPANVRQALLAVSDWQLNWNHRAVKGALWKSATLDMIDLPPSDIIVASKHGRACWFPSAMSWRVNEPSWLHLSVLHSTVSLALLQVESLAAFIMDSLRIPEWDSGGMQLKRVRFALAMLRALYSDARGEQYRDSGYGSPYEQFAGICSARRQINDNYIDDLNKAVKRSGKGKVFVP